MSMNTKKGFNKGIWMIDYSSDKVNFSELEEKSQLQLTEQIKIMHNSRFTMLNYNSGQYTITNIFESLLPNYSALHLRLFGNKKKSKLTNKDRMTLLNYVYNPANSSTYTYGHWQMASHYLASSTAVLLTRKAIGVHKVAEQITGISAIQSSTRLENATLSVFGVK